LLKNIVVMGIRGLPASYGGFETFAENLVVYLVGRDWNVTVYCQESFDDFPEITETVWKGVRLIHIPVKGDSAKTAVIFDYLSVKHALNQPGIVLDLGYNTALFNFWFRLKGKTNIINMDGIEWKRDKWSWVERTWLYLNERAGCLIGHHLVADHPEIKKHLVTRVSSAKISMIPYGARSVTGADVSLLEPFKIKANNYALVIARSEPENSILEIVSAFSMKLRGVKLVVLGIYDESNPYHAKVLSIASNEVKFVGPVYEHDVLDALRFCSLLYIHGHTVGGTNPSLIEALGSGQPVLAHYNRFNCWVAGEGAAYFKDEEGCNLMLDTLLSNSKALEEMSRFSSKRFNDNFTWNSILEQYEELFLKWI
jgi:glycosyltransferase involved in cell wall biosynthesis